MMMNLTTGISVEGVASSGPTHHADGVFDLSHLPQLPDGIVAGKISDD